MAYKIKSPIIVAEGGSGAITLTGVLTGNGTSAITANTVTQYGTVIAGASNAVSSVAPHATSGVPLISQGAAANPLYGTAVVAGGGTGVATMTTAYAPVCAGTTATGALQVASTGLGTAGFILTSTGASSLPTFQAAGTGGVFVWNEITAASAGMSVNNGYIANRVTLITLTLPAVAAIGDIIRVTGKGAGLWLIAQNAGQTIHFGSLNTTTGIGGSLAAILQYDCVELLCITANTDFIVLSVLGNLTVV